MHKRLLSVLTAFFLVAGLAMAGEPANPQSNSKPRVVVFAVNGAEWDILRPLVIRGDMPNLKHIMENGVYGKLRTVSAPNCPKVFTAFATSTPPSVNGITDFVVAGQTANTNMLKVEPIWSILSKHDVTVGMANVPATFPTMPVNGYMISGMLTRGKNCEDGLLCSPKLSEVEGGDAVYPKSMIPELEKNVGDFHIDCSRMPTAEQLKGKEASEVKAWLDGVQQIRDEQTKLFDYLLTNHPTQYTMLDQSCEDRTGHWLYPIQPFNAKYDAKVNSVDVQAFPDQYRAMDKVLGVILKYVDDNTYFFMIADHGIKPLREIHEDNMEAMHHGTTPVIAKHDYPDGDDVPGAFLAMGPGIKKGVELEGWQVSAFDIAPTILHIYGIEPPSYMQGHYLSNIFAGDQTQNAKAETPQMNMKH